MTSTGSSSYVLSLRAWIAGDHAGAPRRLPIGLYTHCMDDWRHALALPSVQKSWLYQFDIDRVCVSVWQQFFEQFEMRDQGPLVSSLVDTFITLAYKQWIVPWDEIFRCGFYADLVESIAIISMDARDRFLAPYVWALSILIASGCEFVPYFRDDRLIQTLVDIGCSEFATSSCHALRSLMDLCSYETEFVTRISLHLDRLIAHFQSIACLHRRKFMCLELIATLAPETEQWRRVGDSLAHGLVCGALEQRTMYLSAINAFVRMPKCLEHMSLIRGVLAVLPTCIRDSRVDATTESLVLTYALLARGVEMPFQAIINSIATSAQTDTKHTVMGFKILRLLVEQRIEIEYIVSSRLVLEPAVRFLERSSYPTKMAALEFLSSIVVWGDRSHQMRVVELGTFQHCSDILVQKQVAGVVFQALLSLVEAFSCTLEHLVPDLEAVAEDHEHPHHLLAARVLESLQSFA